MFCSSHGDDALWALGELALERGDFSDARLHWERISRQLRGPNGRPLWAALRSIDLERDWERVAPVLQEVPTDADWFAYPDTDLDLANVRARFVLVSIREGAFERAEVELAAFTRMHPEAVGRLGGRDVRLATALSEMLSTARGWPRLEEESEWSTYARNPTRNGIAPSAADPIGPAWSSPVNFASVDSQRERSNAESVDLHIYPIVHGGVVYYSDAERVHAVQLATGAPAFNETGVLYARDDPSAPSGTESRSRSKDDRNSLTCYNGRLYALVGGDSRADRAGNARTVSSQRIVGLDVAGGGRLVFEIAPDDASWSFGGAPIADSRGVHVVMRQRDVTERMFIASFDAHTGKMKWRTLIASGNLPAQLRSQSNGCGILSQAGSTLFLNTNLGVVAAVSALDGENHLGRALRIESKRRDRMAPPKTTSD